MDRIQIVWLLDFDGTITTRDSFLPFVCFLAMATRQYTKLFKVALYLSAYSLGLLSAQRSKEKILYLFLQGKSEQEISTLGQNFATLMLSSSERDALPESFGTKFASINQSINQSINHTSNLVS